MIRYYIIRDKHIKRKGKTAECKDCPSVPCSVCGAVGSADGLYYIYYRWKVMCARVSIVYSSTLGGLLHSFLRFFCLPLGKYRDAETLAGVGYKSVHAYISSDCGEDGDLWFSTGSPFWSTNLKPRDRPQGRPLSLVSYTYHNIYRMTRLYMKV